MDSLVEILQATAEIYGKQLSHAAAVMLLTDLSAFPEQQIVAALSRCRKELRQFPTIADILLRIDDGRPGVEEAWALCPISESQTAVWTDEIRMAFFEAAAPLLARDEVAARMAFKEKYNALLAGARAAGRPCHWDVSLGHDKHGQERALRKAVEQGRLTIAEAHKLLPDLSHTAGRMPPQIAGAPTAKLLENITKPMPGANPDEKDAL